MVFALILIVGSPDPFSALRAGTYRYVAECNQRAAWVRQVPGVRAAFCLPVDQ